MRRGFYLAIMIAAAASSAVAQQPEDAAHRADRARTQTLNRAAGGAISRNDRRNAAARNDYQAAQDRYARDLAAWRARFDACNAGDWGACEPAPAPR